MKLTAKDSSDNYPPGYFELRERGLPFKTLRFENSSVAHIHRFAHRYRLAKEFQSANFTTYGPATAAAFSALCKYLFTYSAFEGLRRVLVIEDDLSKFDLSNYPTGEWDAALRAAGTHAKLFACVSWRSKRATESMRTTRRLVADNRKRLSDCLEFERPSPELLFMQAPARRRRLAHGSLAAILT